MELPQLYFINPAGELTVKGAQVPQLQITQFVTITVYVHTGHLMPLHTAFKLMVYVPFAVGVKLAVTVDPPLPVTITEPFFVTSHELTAWHFLSFVPLHV